MTGDSVIVVDGKRITIEDFYNKCFGKIDILGEDNFVKHVIGHKSLCFDTDMKVVTEDKINYVMKHKVKKRMFKIKVNGKEVVVTEDHSIMVLRNGCVIECKPNNIQKGDKLVCLL